MSEPATTDLDVHLSAIAAGDSEAFGLWVAGAELRLRSSLLRFARQVDVESVLQESLLRVWQVAPRITVDGRGDSLLRFAIRTARNLAISEIRRDRQVEVDPRSLERMIEEDPKVPPQPFPDPLLRRIIQRCRSLLPPKQAQVLAARIRSSGGVSDQTLAEQQGMRLNTFLQNFTRARRSLAECLKRSGVDIENPT